MKQYWFLALSLLLLVSCATDPNRNAVVFQEPQSISARDAQKLKARARALWGERHIKEKLKESIELWEQISRTTAVDREVLQTLSHGYYHLADAHEDDVEIKKALWEKGIAFGEHALNTNPAFKKLMERGSTLEEALHALNRDDAGAVLWTSANLGKWAQHSGMRTQIRYEVRIKELIRAVDNLWPGYFHGAVQRYWGAFYAVAPRFFGRDLEKSENSFKRSLEISPHYLGTKVLMAEVFYTEKGDREAFEKTLNEVINTPDNVQKNILTENLMEKSKARKLLKRADELF